MLFPHDDTNHKYASVVKAMFWYKLPQMRSMQFTEATEQPSGDNNFLWAGFELVI